MDSSAYKHLIGSLQADRSLLSTDLPSVMALQQPTLTHVCKQALAGFLELVLPKDEDENATQPSLPCPHLLSRPESNFFAGLLALAHRELRTHLQPGCEGPRNYRRNGAELVRFLCHTVDPQWVSPIRDEDVTGLAMCCFLLEACMHMGWCPNAFEGRAKRAAHILFAHTRKSLHHLRDREFSVVLGYLWGAWLYAQKTEGIRDHVLQAERVDLTHRFSWRHGTTTADYHVFRFRRPEIFLMISQIAGQMPCAFRFLTNDTAGSLVLHAGDKVVEPIELRETVSITRPRHTGIAATYLCATPSGQLLWRVALQIHMRTVYRIDVIRPTASTCNITRADLYLENELPLSRVGNSYLGKGPDSFALELLQNPFGLSFHDRMSNRLSLFSGPGATLTPEEPLEMISAWASGPGVSSIDRTNLPGIFDV